jgi:hypothetical protein
MIIDTLTHRIGNIERQAKTAYRQRMVFHRSKDFEKHFLDGIPDGMNMLSKEDSGKILFIHDGSDPEYDPEWQLAVCKWMSRWVSGIWWTRKYINMTEPEFNQQQIDLLDSAIEIYKEELDVYMNQALIDAMKAADYIKENYKGATDGS